MDNSMLGKICLITGANSGIGFETALGIANKGASVVLACRSEEKGKDALDKIKKITGNLSVDMVTVDLSSQSSIRKFAGDFQSKYKSLHILINNAGGINGKKEYTEDGFEMTFAINYLAPYLLTRLLLPVLISSAPSRIINVSSGAHFMGRIDFSNLQGEKSYGVMNSYGNAKLALILFTHELSKRLDGTGVTVNSLHPGFVNTNFGGSEKGLVHLGINIAKSFAISPKEGAKTSIYLASSPEVEKINGKYFEKSHLSGSSTASYNEETAKKLWETSEKLLKLEGVSVTGGHFETMRNSV